jgi:hypothetical protein
MTSLRIAGFKRPLAASPLLASFLAPFTQATLALVAVLAAVLPSGGCSPASSTSTNLPQPMHVLSCSLGCTDGTGGALVGCSIINTFRNQEISVLFSADIDLFSVNASSFRVLDIANGTSPPGEFSIDPFNRRRLIFRPALNFDANGNPEFGFGAFTSYQVTIPGEAQGDSPPFVTSTSGRVNQSRLQCTIETSNEILDPVPGPPSVQIFTDVYLGDDVLGDPILALDQLVNGGVLLEEVWAGTASDPATIRFVFDDIMNLASVVNPQTGTSPFIFIQIDDDGDLASSSDRTVQSGTFREPGPPVNAFVDQSTLQTFLVFEADVPFPSSGFSVNPRRVTIDIGEAVVDLKNNGVTVANGGGIQSFIPRQVAFPPFDITEEFTFNAPNPDSNEDVLQSGAVWGGGRLVRSNGGGSGRLGALKVKVGEVITLSTDSQVFPIGVNGPIDVTGNSSGSPLPPNGTPGGFPDQITVTDGVFEFTSLIVEPGGLLRLEGGNPARIYSNGPVDIASGALVSLTGASPTAQDSMNVLRNLPSDWAAPSTFSLGEVVHHRVGGLGPVNRYRSLNAGNTGIEPGVAADWELSWAFEGIGIPVSAAGGGDGGKGGDRYTYDPSADFSNMIFTLAEAPSNAVDIPGVIEAENAANTPGRDGMGVGRGALARGRGGPPISADPYPALNSSVLTTDHDLVFNVLIFDGGDDNRCTVSNIAGVGSGGGYSSSGSSGQANSFQPSAEWPLGDPTNGPPTLPGLTSDLGLAMANAANLGYIQRKLNWRPNSSTPYPGFLRGGAGGGGGANHAIGSTTSGFDGAFENPCILETVDLNGLIWTEWHDHSGANGGFGGGALQLVSGKSISLNGIIDLRGGNGGSAMTGLPGEYSQYALPGGGGSGGALRLQAPDVIISPLPGRIDIRGGSGGTAAWSGIDLMGESNTFGGDGGAGLVRIEGLDGVKTHIDYAPSILPVDLMDPLSLEFLSVDTTPFVMGGPPAGWGFSRHRPEGISSSTSCWVRPEGNFYKLNLREDLPGNDPDDMGWNMTVLWQPPMAADEIEVPFRGVGPDSPFAGSFEDQFGKDLGPFGPNGEGAPIVVRFQGARHSLALDSNNSMLAGDPCNLDLSGASGYVVPGSVSPWVDHPALLNAWAEDFGAESPNMFRYKIIFDGTVSEDLPGDDPGLTLLLSVNGITDLRVSGDPD